MKKIKILRIIARLNIGGPAIHTILLTGGMDKSKFETLLICGNIDKTEGDMLYYSNDSNIKPVFIPELKRELNFFNDIAALRKIYKVIKSYSPDIVHTHTAKAGAVGRLAGIFYNCFHFSKENRIKLIHTFHGHIFEGYFSRFKSKLFILIERILAFFTTKIVTVSESLKEELVSLGISKESRIAVIPLGLELKNFLEIAQNESPVLNIGIVGRLVPVKNHFLFLEAAAKVIAKNRGMRLRFEIIGDGELRQNLEGHSHKLGINGQVSFLGWQKDLVNIYSNLDVVALTSINEGTPVSLIEAMASARAVVSTDVGGVRDLLGDEAGGNSQDGFKVLERGIVVKPEDADSFAEALVFILENAALRRELGFRARNFAKDKFSKDRLISDIELLYNSTLRIK